ncbi:MAG: MBL fold metallo-hydrolase [Desulfovibrio sp.]|nr:MBL fold metallo-hydrolase [Desulfovibrio sp.]
MKIKQIRNATLKITFAGQTFLTDPWLADQGAMGTFAKGSYRSPKAEQNNIAMPICALPFPREEILKGVDAYLITHVHPDHLDLTPDGKVGPYLERSVPSFVQNSEDAKVLCDSGFTDVNVLYEDSHFGPCQILPTPARHGTKIPCGPAKGIILKAQNEPTLYLAGDTIWYSAIHKTILAHKPKVIVLNACAATLENFGRLIMDDADVEAVYHACPQAKIIISHLDNVAHAFLDRSSMREALQKRGLLERVYLPNDGESYTFD